MTGFVTFDPGQHGASVPRDRPTGLFAGIVTVVERECSIPAFLIFPTAPLLLLPFLRAGTRRPPAIEMPRYQ